ncbi:MAG: ACP S-malonyltransferase [Deltaproteobacteria bacterium]|nr:ACP S-malonyltransferase [Deltaproteobacteria bacterium]
MKKTAFVFPGQGSQYVGMGRSFFDGYAVARATFEEAGDAIGIDMAKLCFEGPSEALDRTENTQPALLTASMAAFRALNEEVDITPSFMAGHSLGEYTALVAAGSLDFRDAVKLVKLRGRFMQESVPAGTGKMCAILGLDIEAVEVICDSASIDAAVVVPANINSPAQIVISGHAVAVDIAAGLAKERGAKRVVELQVSAPSHSPLMIKAAERLASELAGTAFATPKVPVLTNVEAQAAGHDESIREILIRQLTSPVQWVGIIQKMRKEGVECIIEIGPNKVLSGLNKRIEKDIESVSLDTAPDIGKVIEAVGATPRR